MNDQGDVPLQHVPWETVRERYTLMAGAIAFDVCLLGAVLQIPLAQQASKKERGTETTTNVTGACTSWPTIVQLLEPRGIISDNLFKRWRALLCCVRRQGPCGCIGPSTLVGYDARHGLLVALDRFDSVGGKIGLQEAFEGRDQFFGEVVLDS